MDSIIRFLAVNMLVWVAGSYSFLTEFYIQHWNIKKIIQRVWEKTIAVILIIHPPSTNYNLKQSPQNTPIAKALRNVLLKGVPESL
jgi:hypothetical protein